LSSQQQQQQSLNITVTVQPTNPTTTIGEGITLVRHSPDSGSGLIYSSASSNRSLGEVPSGKDDSSRNKFQNVTNSGQTQQNVCRRVASTSHTLKSRPYSQGDFIERRRSVVLVSSVSGNNDCNHTHTYLPKKPLSFNSHSHNRGGQQCQHEKSQSVMNLRNASVSKSNTYIVEDKSKNGVVTKNNNNQQKVVVDHPVIKVVGIINKEIKTYKVGTKNIINNNFVGQVASPKKEVVEGPSPKNKPLSNKCRNLSPTPIITVEECV
jgi:hypothetical protein